MSDVPSPGMSELPSSVATPIEDVKSRADEPAPPDARRETPVAEREAARLGLERELLARRAGTRARVPAEPKVQAIAAPAAPEAAAPAPGAWHPTTAQTGSGVLVPTSGLAADQLVHTLRRELDARATAEASLRARVIDAEARLTSRVLLDQRTPILLGELRTELDGLGQMLARERELRAQAERHAAALERELEGPRERSRDAIVAGSDASAAQAGPADPAGPVEPARLNQALARLRQTVVPEATVIEPAPAREPVVPGAAGSRPTLRIPFERLARDDAEAAGRILLELLALQGAAYPHPVSYDLVLGAGRGCVSVSVGGDAPEIVLRSDPRPSEAVDFQVFAEPARIARMLSAPRGLRRRLARRRSKVTGRRERVSALEALLDVPLDLGALHRAGVRLDACAALELVARMIEPNWTIRERFTLAHQDPDGDSAYLEVAAGRPIAVTPRAPEGRIATTIVCPADDLLPALAGELEAGLRVEGDRGPLAVLREWIKRAQSDQSR